MAPPVPGAVEQPFPPEFGMPPQPLEVQDPYAGVPMFDPSQFQPPEGYPPPVDPMLQGAPQPPIGALPQDMGGETPEYAPPPPIPGAPVPFDAELAGPPMGPGQQEQAPQYVPPGQEANALRGLEGQAPPISDVEELYGLKARQQDVEAEGLYANEQTNRQRLDMIALKNQQREGMKQQAADDVAQAWDEVKNTKINDNALWDNASDMGKALTVIGAALGGFLAVRRGGKNMFMETYQQMVADNIAAQKANLATKKDVAGAKETIYARMLQRFGDEESADYATAGIMYKAGANEALAKAGLMRSDITRQEGVMAAQSLDAAAQANMAAAAQKQFENRLKVAEFEEKSEHNAYTAKTGRISAYETGRHNRATEGINSAELEIKRKAAGPKAIPLYGKDGPAAGPVGFAGDEKVADRAAIQMEGMSELDALAKRGEELLKDDYAVYGSDRRVEIEQWNAAWQNARFRASGRTDAPSEQERKTSGIDPSRVIGDNRVAFRESYNTARKSAAAKLRTAGVTDDYIKRAGWLDPPAPPKVTGKTESVLMFDESTGEFNTEGRGRTATPDEVAWKKSADKREQSKRPSVDDWKYKRSQNNIAAGAGRPLPFPEAGTGSIE